MLSKRALLATALIAVGAGSVPFAATADGYPDRPITLVVPMPPAAAPTPSPR